MDSILNMQFERVLQEFRILDEVKGCMNDMIFHLELREKDDEM